MSETAVIEIVERPTTNMRYNRAGRLGGSIIGINSTVNERTFPAIRLLNYTGAAFVIASCVTKDKPYLPHPHSLIGNFCKKGVFKMSFRTDSSAPTTISFRNLGIHRTKKNEVVKMLSQRKSQRIDPFNTGFKNNENLDLSAVRVCLQVILLPDLNNETPPIRLRSILSAPIYDKKSLTDLHIYSISDMSSPVTGGKKISIFCEKFLKDDIKVRFLENSENTLWEDWGVPIYANPREGTISFATPKYKKLNIARTVDVFLQLVRPSDQATSEPLPFRYTPSRYPYNPVVYLKRPQSG